MTLLLLAASFLLAHAACREPPADNRTEGTRRMARLLNEIAEEVEPLAHPYANDLRVRHFRDEAARLRKAADPLDPRVKSQLFRTRLDLANELLLDGQSEAAIAEFRALRAEASGRRMQHRLQIFLGLAYLRLGEQENCILDHNTESCLFRSPAPAPTRRPGARAAAAEFAGVLQRNPGDLSSRWLLNIACMNLGGYPESVPPEQLMPPHLFESITTSAVFATRPPAGGGWT